MYSPDVGIDIEWTVLDKLFGSDHMPVSISEITLAKSQKHHRFNLDRADWKAYKSLTYLINDEECLLDEMLFRLEHLI